MNACQALDSIVTRFVDGECTDDERIVVDAHLGQCLSCRERVAAESTARSLLAAQAAAARAIGVQPPWRPRVWRLGRPLLPVAPAALLLVSAIGIALFGVWPRPARAATVGVIGDSYCQHVHRFTERFNVGDRECTLGCVKRGAQFVLVTDTEVYQLRNPDMAMLVRFANTRVKVTGAVTDQTITIASIAPADQ